MRKQTKQAKDLIDAATINDDSVQVSYAGVSRATLRTAMLNQRAI
jgi:hypothetical protein